MSFIENKTGRSYTAGYFLAHEECERKTREMTQEMATTAENGAKYVPMGTIYPSNDANAEGIVYEDVDVSTGNMAGSVVVRGSVIESRLPVTGANYDAVTPETGDNPAEKGWYERSGSAGAYVYTLTTDTTVSESKTYYAKSDVRIAPAAKTALAAKGFTFVADDPEVVRPY